MDLQHALPRREAARRRHLLDQRLDVGAEELEGAVAALADQMEVPGMTIRVLEAEPALAEIDLAGDAGLDHPLEGPVDGRPADPLIFTANQIDELVGGEVTFLPEKDVDDEVALAGSLAACRPQAVYVGRGRNPSGKLRPPHGATGALACYTAERRTAAAGRLRVRVLDREAAAGDVVDEVHFGAGQVAGADRIDQQLDAVRPR